MSDKSEQVLIITDVCRDVDDVLALTVAQAFQMKGLIDLKGIITTHMIPGLRAKAAELLAKLFSTNLPVAVGSTYPIGHWGEAKLLHDYLMEHQYQGKTYEGVGLAGFEPYSFNIFREPEELILKTLHEASLSGEKVNIVVLAPFTDVAKALIKNENVFKKGVKRIYVMGNAKQVGNKLLPDSVAYNIKEDVRAAEYTLRVCQELGIPFTFVGKHAVYQAPLFASDFWWMAQTGHLVGQYLQKHAALGLLCFAERLPELFAKLYNNGLAFDKADPLANVTKWSNPYDPVTMLALTHPELFLPVEVNGNLLIGQTPDTPGIVDKNQLKKELLDKVLFPLIPAQDRLGNDFHYINAIHVRPTYAQLNAWHTAMFLGEESIDWRRAKTEVIENLFQEFTSAVADEFGVDKESVHKSDCTDETLKSQRALMAFRQYQKLMLNADRKRTTALSRTG